MKSVRGRRDESRGKRKARRRGEGGGDVGLSFLQVIGMITSMGGRGGGGAPAYCLVSESPFSSNFSSSLCRFFFSSCVALATYFFLAVSACPSNQAFIEHKDDSSPLKLDRETPDKQVKTARIFRHLDASCRLFTRAFIEQTPA